MRMPYHRTTTARRHAVRLFTFFLLSGLLSGVAMSTITVAQSTLGERSASIPHADHIAEAAQRFRIPERWIRAVMQVESAGRERAVSSAGAMGLMQIMPDTWTELRARYRLGGDPFDTRDNILGGTAYLREMYDRFGSPGFLAAYNAGPGRYEEHLATGRALPRETRDYMATLLPMLGLTPLDGRSTVTAPPPDWREAPLFVERLNRSSAASPVQEKRRLFGGPTTRAVFHEAAQNEPTDSVFVAQSREERTP